MRTQRNVERRPRGSPLLFEVRSVSLVHRVRERRHSALGVLLSSTSCDIEPHRRLTTPPEESSMRIRLVIAGLACWLSLVPGQGAEPRRDPAEDQGQRHHLARPPRVVDPVLLLRRQAAGGRLLARAHAEGGRRRQEGARTCRSWQVKLTPVTSQNRIPLVQNGTIDLECGSTTNNLERQKQVGFSNTIFIVGTRLLDAEGLRHQGLPGSQGQERRHHRRHDLGAPAAQDERGQEAWG